MGFNQSSSDACLYMKDLGRGEWIYLLIYVDDIIMACRLQEEIDKVQRELGQHFRITALGPVSHFLGIAVTRGDDGIYTINQGTFIQKIAEEYCLDGTKKSSIPMDVGYYKHSTNSEYLPDNTKYHSLVGSLLYISTNTRPDIAASISILSRKIKNPTDVDWTELKRTVKYLYGTANFGLKLGSTVTEGQLKLEAFCDADWAGDTVDRKSNSGFVFRLGQSSVSWGSRKQPCVSVSTMEAEYVALAEVSQEATWLRRLLTELGEVQSAPTVVWEDNRSCIDFVALEKQNRRSKHIDTKFHYVKDLVAGGAITLRYCATDNMLADVMTKPLGPAKMRKFADMLGLVAIKAGHRS